MSTKKTVLVMVGALAASLSFSACELFTSESQGNMAMGEKTLSLSQDLEPHVADISMTGPVLFRTEAEWDAWWEDSRPAGLVLPDGMNEPSFTDSVAVAGIFPRCQQSSSIQLINGELHFSIHEPDGEDTVHCVWSPLTFDVYEIPLSELDVDTSSDINLSDVYHYD